MSAFNTFDPINILDSTNAVGVGTGGALTVEGGISIKKDTYIGGNLSISGTTTSFADNIIVINKNPISSVDTGILFERHSNDISGNKNYTGIIYNEQTDEINFGYLQEESVSSLVENISIKAKALSLTDSLVSVGISSGNLNTNISGDVTLVSTNDSIGIGSGGSLTVLGGVAISKSLRSASIFGTLGTIGNLVATTTLSTGTVRSSSIFGTTSTIGTLRNTNLINTNISAGTVRATTSVIATGNTNTIGSIVTTGGNVGIGTVAPTSSLHVIGNGLFTSTTNASGVGTGGALTIGGGTSIANDLYVGGNIIGNNWKVSVQSSSFTVSATDKNTLFMVSNSTTVTLPNASSVGSNFLISIQKTDSIDNQISIIPTTSLINGRPVYVMSIPDESLMLISNGTNWVILNTRNVTLANVYSLPGTYTFTVPNPVTSIYACVFGAGGGGGSGAASGSGNGGGGGGYVEGTMSVSPGDSLTITVGEGGDANSAGGNSSVGDLLATGGGAGGTNSSGSWGSNGSAGSGSGGTINRTGGSGGQAPAQTSGGGGGGGAAGFSAAGVSGNGYIGGNGSNGSGGAGATSVVTAGGSVRVFNFYREGGGGAAGNLSGTSTTGANGGFPGGGGSGSAGGNNAGNGGDGAIIIFY